ncbi:hypothetical protein [Paenibacillus humicus]|uniref:hypothetical protein n=1 Tax=Paenibacillus humicus TaxID=412861 RepID=UPI000FDA82CD|nr:hypothetical protein [Paenibacillus humicus]
MSEQGQTFILNRGKNARPHELAEDAQPKPEPVSGSALKAVERADAGDLLQQAGVNSALASQFPDWDLKPPAVLIKRRSSRL